MGHFKAINTSARLADEVYQQILDAITAGVVDPHKRIVQERLADQLQVSRTPIREALIRLENEGVLVRVGRSGYKVRPVGEDEVLHIYQAREAIECYAAACLSQNAGADCVKRLRGKIKEHENQPKSTAKDYFEANRNVHRAFVIETGNPFLLEMFDAIWNKGRSFYLFAEMVDVDLPESLEDHYALCDAIASGDEQKAAQSMRAHIRDGLQLQRIALAAKNPSNFNTKAGSE